ncbi:KCNH2 [Symbiodinium natans]|uniref:KCNH2 protein n=1 Tax=Symbiodinium natans TaxID=878477 RepID=A0A812IDF3_9DINO|nr:KCNH2 [Symbiodinium natans]
MSTVGLGDINMNLSNERALLCIIMATTSLVVGVAVNGVAQIVSKLSERTAVANEQLAKVGRFLRVYAVPDHLQSRVHNYLLQFFENQEREETKSMLMRWLKKSEVLRVNVNMALTGTCLATHHLLQLVPREILVNICDICDMEFHPPGQELILAGAEVKSCFYIRRGLVQMRTGESSRAMTAKSLPFPGSGDEMEDMDEIQKEIEAVEAARPDEQLHGGAFIGDVRLFLGSSRSWKTVVCLSFCELISVDVDKFRGLMVGQLPELFDVLVIYSAIDNNCPKALQRCMEEQGLSPEVPLLFGEGVLHHCAKKNADICADFLVEQLGADVTVLDQEEKTPAQVAARLKHKEVFWAVIKHGSIITDQDVLPKEAQSVRSRSKRRVQVSSSGSLEEELFGQRDGRDGVGGAWSGLELRERLQQSGLSLGRYGREGHKSLEDLAAELHTCQSELVLGPGKRLRRRVKLVRLQLLAIIDKSVRALVELQSDAWLRAPDQKLGKLPCRRILRDETVEQATKAEMG